MSSHRPKGDDLVGGLWHNSLDDPSRLIVRPGKTRLQPEAPNEGSAHAATLRRRCAREASRVTPVAGRLCPGTPQVPPARPIGRASHREGSCV
jgi:hypothetical protein